LQEGREVRRAIMFTTTAYGAAAIGGALNKSGELSAVIELHR
jgi:hypothetical protein